MQRYRAAIRRESRDNDRTAPVPRARKRSGRCKAISLRLARVYALLHDLIEPIWRVARKRSGNSESAAYQRLSG
jgi:hypothetical protein